MGAQQIPKSHKETLAPHVASGESVEAVHTWPMEDSKKSETVAVTDRRFFRLIEGEERDSGREYEIVETIPLDKVSRAKMEFRGEEPVSWEEVLLGAILAIFAVPVFLWGSNQSNPVDQIAVIGALVLLVVGLLAIAYAYDTDDGSVTLRLRTADGERESVVLPEGRTDFAETAINEIES